MREPDATFADPRQAVLYDTFDNDRSDLEAYVAIAHEVEAHRVVDVGCGTGTLAVLLAELGLSVTGVDPAGACLDVARAKPNAELVTWVHGDATSLRRPLVRRRRRARRSLPRYQRRRLACSPGRPW